MVAERSDLRRVRCPVVLLRSAESPIFTNHVAARTEALLSDCRLATLPGGHFAPFEHVNLALVEVERFLSPLAAEQRSAEDGVR